MGETLLWWQGTYLVHMDVAEMLLGNGYVLQQYLDIAVYLSPLAV
jgi:hypothetical protein